jgi:hypothetical protein
VISKPPGAAPLTPQEQSALSAALQLLQAVDGSSAFLFHAADPPSQGSKRDRANRTDLADAYIHAGALLYASEDHLRTIQSVIQSGLLPTYALWTMLRTSAEAEVRCRHLLDLGVAEVERLARGLNERFDNLIEQRKATRDLAFFRQRVAHLEQRATANGIAPVYAKTKGTTGDVVGFGEPAKSVVEFFDLYFTAGSKVFRYLGGHVHSKPWVQLPMSRARPTSDPKVSTIPTELNVILFAAVLNNVLMLRDGSVRAWLVLSGYPPNLWANAKA